VRIAVVDTGLGIKPENRAKIFDPYFTTKSFGHGLGLATVYSIIKKHQGHIEVESTAGSGTTFTIWLPASHEQPPPPGGNSRGPVEALKGRALFMDDDTTIQRVAAKIFPRLGLAVDFASDGQQAVQMYRDALAAGKRYDVVIMDLTIPGGMGGKEAITSLRAIDPAVKAIVSSGYSSDPVMADFRVHGFSGMVSKPYDITELLRTVRRVLELKV
jgi:CheY-like chemotaxis protein